MGASKPGGCLEEAWRAVVNGVRVGLKLGVRQGSVLVRVDLELRARRGSSGVGIVCRL